MSWVIHWQERLLAGVELHVEGGQQRRRPGIIPHQRDEVDQRAAAEPAERPCEGGRRDLARGEDLAAELDDDPVGLVECGGILAVFDDVDDLGSDPLAQYRGLVRYPL